MCRKILFFIGMMLWLAASVGAADKKFTLVIDAGHGGRDAGAVGKISKEKDLTLKFALAFGQMVERNCPDVKVIYTRKTDRFLELWQRAEIANKNNADLFISVHINSVGGGKVVRGFQSYTLGRGRVSGSTRGLSENLEVTRRENSVIEKEDNQAQKLRGYDPYSPESFIIFEMLHEQNMSKSVELSQLMLKHVCAATGRRNAGAYQDNLAVLRLSSMPGCLIELGFISTRDEESYMNSKEATQQYARGIYNAFVAYKKRYFGGAAAAAPAPKQEAQKQAPSKQAPPAQKQEAPLPASPSDSVASAATGSQPSNQQPSSQQPSDQRPPAQQSPQPPASQPSAPIFKVQFLTSGRKLAAGDAQFKGLKDVDSYKEGTTWKYTVGASANYPEVYQLLKQVRQHFPEAFIIAYRDGVKMDAGEAYKEYKQNRAK